MVVSIKYLLITALVAATPNLGGIQLMMTLEQQKKMERTMGYLNQDFEQLNNLLIKALFDKTNQKQSIKKNPIITSEDQEILNSLAGKLSKNFSVLIDYFHHVYSYAHDDRVRNEFIQLKKYIEELNSFCSLIHEKSSDELHSFYDSTSAANNKVEIIDHLIQSARITTDQEIKDQLSKMSIWQWLFGY